MLLVATVTRKKSGYHDDMMNPEKAEFSSQDRSDHVKSTIEENKRVNQYK